MSWGVIRSRSPSFRDAPFKDHVYVKFLPDFVNVQGLPLRAKTEVLEVTRNPSTFAKPLINSSVNPLLKYSSSGSAPILTNGSTAIEACLGSIGGSLAADC